MREDGEDGLAMEGYAPHAFEHAGGDETAPHRHEEGQIVLVRHGAVEIRTRAGAWSMPAGFLGWIPPRHEHRAFYRGAVRIEGLRLSPDLCGALPTEPVVLRRSDLLDAALARLASPPRAGDTPSGHDRSLHDRIRRHRILGVLIDELAAAEPEPLVLPMPRDDRLVRVARALLGSLEEDRPLDALASGAALSRRNLTRLFREETGLSVGRWRTRQRMIAAVGWLAEGRTVTETALALGYDNVGAFAQAFRRTVGISPSSARSGGRRPPV